MSNPIPTVGFPELGAACSVDFEPSVPEYRNRLHSTLMKLLATGFLLQHSELLDYSVKGGKLQSVNWVSKIVQIVVLKGGLIYEYELQESRVEVDGKPVKRLTLVMSVLDSVNNLNFACVNFNLKHPRMIADTESFLQRWMGVFCDHWDVCVGSAPLQVQRHLKQQGLEEALEREEQEVMNVLGTALMKPEKFSHHYFFRPEVGVNLWRYFIVGNVLNNLDEHSYMSNF